MASIIFKDTAGNITQEIPLCGGGTTVPAEVRQAILTLFESAAYASDNVSAAITTVRSWAMEVTAIEINQSAISISGSNTVQLVATTTPAGGTVTWTSSNTAVATVSSSGLVTGVGNGTATITARCGDLTATCTATVSGFATLTGITATYTQSGTVYDTASLSDLVSDLVVVANYDNSSTVTLTSDQYTLSGTLAEGTSVITVSYGGMQDTFSVTVTHATETVTVMFSDSTIHSGTLIKNNGSTASISNGSYVELPYVDGMYIRSLMVTSWAAYHIAVLFDGTNYTAVSMTDQGTSDEVATLHSYDVTLNGYSGIQTVFVNTGNNGIPYGYYSYTT